MKSRWAVALFAWACSSCGEPFAPLMQSQLEIALGAAAALHARQLGPTIAELYGLRLADPNKDTTRGAFCGGDEPCVYTRGAVRDWIRSHWTSERFRGRARLVEQLRDDDGFVTHNLFLDLAGHSLPNEWVLATAHYDAWYGGAVDNASGVAVVLGAADVLVDLELDRSVRFLLFDGEELGMVGSRRYVEDFGVSGVVAVLNADMVAFRADPGGFFTGDDAAIDYWVQANEASAGDAYRMSELGRRLPRPLSLKPLVFPGNGMSPISELSGVARSDHAPFWSAGVPALFPFPVGDKPKWHHTAQDTPDKVDAERLERMGRLWVASLAAFATRAR